MSIVEHWVNDIRPEDLPDPYNNIALEIGVDQTMKIALRFGGTQVYFPKYDSVLSNARDRQIRKEYDGYNTKELALKFNLTENWVRSIVRGKSPEEDLDQNQLKLFDDDPL
ncbi:Mor transcription activator family protein [Cohnella nanjingensis]|uniref:Mor transcription activator domain-containing protein n=1 Tax=Cohnella nanjingensis TaxID=1387779 RepID=A0A7X0RSQ6_9BACL|nr:Mor transcription activator family protein [Cohnella nanjingensis]MBB6673002.1 hypothetical protein [Cohnella nanjingensis]